LVRYVSKVAPTPQVFIRTARWHSTPAERGYFLTKSRGCCLDWTSWNNTLATTIAWCNTPRVF